MADTAANIASAYDDAVKRLVNQLILNYTDAAGDAAQEKAADDAFAKGLQIARRAVDRAGTLANA